MKDIITTAADAVSMFCRLQINSRKDIPIRSSEMGVLIYVSKQTEEVTPLIISKFFQIAKPSVTNMINALIKSNYLQKEPSATDGRSYFVSITDKGRRLVESTHDEYFKMIGILEENMGEQDFLQFLKLLEKANKILSEERRA
jgi:DNA-binding MarR family transcriptional regulator